MKSQEKATVARTIRPRPVVRFATPSLLVATAMAMAMALTGCFRVSSDAQALRDSVMRSVPGDWDERIEIGVGRLTLGLAKTGLFLANLDPEIEAALKSVRGAQVGVYALPAHTGDVDATGLLANADEAMARRGWDRVVGVIHSKEIVAVYFPQQLRSTRDVKFCVAVLNGNELVIASARGSLEPLVDSLNLETLCK